MREVQWPMWVKVVAALPATVMLRVLFSWDPRSKRQWLWTAGMVIYLSLYFYLFVR